MKYTVILEPNPEGGYTVLCPALPGCVSEGETIDEALEMILDAMIAWLALAKEKNLSPTPETPDLVAQEIAVILSERAEEGLDLTLETRVVEVAAGIAR